MFRDDFEFNDNVAPSHLAAEGHAARPEDVVETLAAGPTWDLNAERELRKIPFFVRGKARRNTEQFAVDRGVSIIKVDTLYEAKAHFSR